MNSSVINIRDHLKKDVSNGYSCRDWVVPRVCVCDRVGIPRYIK